MERYADYCTIWCQLLCRVNLKKKKKHHVITLRWWVMKKTYCQNAKFLCTKLFDCLIKRPTITEPFWQTLNVVVLVCFLILIIFILFVNQGMLLITNYSVIQTFVSTDVLLITTLSGLTRFHCKWMFFNAKCQLTGFEPTASHCLLLDT